MSRAFGDYCIKEFGLISVPEVTHRSITSRDQFIILATDGVSKKKHFFCSQRALWWLQKRHPVNVEKKYQNCVTEITPYSFCSFVRYGMLSPTKKQWRLYRQHRIERNRRNVWSSVLFGHGNGRDEALQWMIYQLSVSSSTPHQSKMITLYPHYRRKEPIS